MKRNRSTKYTKGITINAQIEDYVARFPFFELDLDHKRYFHDVVNHYRGNGLDYLCHRTGNGYHFLTPCVVTKEEWKRFHEPVKHINPSCPMTTLRWLPNKYPNESSIWNLSEYWKAEDCQYQTSIEMANLLNTTFGSKFEGSIHTGLEFVRYPLPLIDGLPKRSIWVRN